MVRKLSEKVEQPNLWQAKTFFATIEEETQPNLTAENDWFW